MSILVRLPWDSQPQEVTGVDWDNPLATGIAGLWLPASRDLVNCGGLLGTLTGTNTTLTATRYGIGHALNGTSAFLTQTGQSVVTDIPLTLAVWVNLNTVAGPRRVFDISTGTTANDVIGIQIDGTSVRAQHYDGSTEGLANSGIFLATNTWYRLVAVFESLSSRKIYANGVLLASNTTTVVAPSGINRVTIGYAPWSSAEYLNGTVVAPALLKRAWSAAEVQSDYQNNWQLFAPKSILVPVGASSGVTGTSATTNANDASSASGTTTIVGTSATTDANDTATASGSVGGAVTGTSATTNANDAAAASGTTTVTGTVAYSNANDSVAASGWAGIVSGTAAATNANDTAQASGTAGEGATDTHDGYWTKQWLKLRKKPEPPTIAEVVEMVRDEPQMVEAVRVEVERKYPQVDYAAIAENVQLQRFIAKQLIEAAQEEDDIEAMLLLA